MRMNQGKRLTPTETVRAFCMECLGLTYFNKSEIESCRGDTCVNGCALFPYRLGRRIPVKVFRRFCTECMNGQEHLIPECPATRCKIHQYRLGKNPARQGQGDIKNIPARFRGWGFERQNATIRQRAVSP